jgi:hypothetical protein
VPSLQASDLSIKTPGVLSGYCVRSRSLKFLKLPLEDVAAGRAGINEMAGRIHESSTPPHTTCSNDDTGLEANQLAGCFGAAQHHHTLRQPSRFCR